MTQGACWEVKFAGPRTVHVAMPVGATPNDIEKVARLGLEEHLSHRIGGPEKAATAMLTSITYMNSVYLDGGLG